MLQSIRICLIVVCDYAFGKGCPLPSAFFLTGKLPWGTLPMTPCFPNKWIEPKDLFLGLSSRQHSSCLGKHVNWRRKNKSEQSAPLAFLAQMPIWKLTFVCWTTLIQGGRPVFSLACPEQTQTNCTGLPGVSSHDLQFCFALFEKAQEVNLYSTEQERQRYIIQVPAVSLC